MTTHTRRQQSPPLLTPEAEQSLPPRRAFVVQFREEMDATRGRGAEIINLRGYFNSADPTLVSSGSSILPTPYGHGECHDAEFVDAKAYQSLVEVNHPPLFV